MTLGIGPRVRPALRSDIWITASLCRHRRCVVQMSTVCSKFARLLLVHAALVLAALLLAPSAGAVAIEYQPLATLHRTLEAGAAVERADCATTRLARRSGVTTTSWTTPRAVSVAARIAGPAGNDWDLAVFDHATGRRLSGSSAWGADELVQTFVAGGRRLDFQACRVSGSAHSVPLTIYAVELPPAPKGGVLKEQLIRIDLPNRQALGVVEGMGIDLVEDPSPVGVSAVIRTPQELELLHNAGFGTTVLVPDLAAADRKEAARNRTYTASVGAAGSSLPSGRSEYRHLPDVQADLKKLAQQYPAIVRPVTLPKKTFLGRDTIGVEISSDVNRADDQKPVSFIMGVHHAREWPSAELTTEFALHLAQNFGTDAELTEMLRRVRVVVVPVINGDGFNASREATDFADASGDPGGAPSLAESAGAGGSLAYRRKNCNGIGQNPAIPCDAQVGIDPNRNYGFGWGGPGASTQPNSQTYRGTGPWSEPETQAVHEFSQVHNVTSLLTMHNFASLVLRPPGLHTQGQAPDEARLKELGDAMGDDTGYTSQYGWQLYDTSGTTEDWNYGAAGTFGYTIELGPESGDGGNFHISYDRGVVEQWEGRGSRKGRGVRKALLRIAQWAASRPDFGTIYGRAPAGRILRLKKTFKTSTSPICRGAALTDVNVSDADDCISTTDPILVDDKLDYTTKVPANGVFSWIVTPSTSPFVYRQGKRESYTLTCEDGSGKVFQTQTVTIWRGEVQKFELPCGGRLLPAGPPLADRRAPRSSFTRKGFRPTRSGVAFRGRSTDTAPKGLTPRVAKVMVSLWRRQGPKGSYACRFITAQGALGPKTNCHRVRFVPARVTRPARSVGWRYTLNLKLPAGLYIARVRGIDAAGNTERLATKANGMKFRIR
jgi:hypothetical protein